MSVSDLLQCARCNKAECAPGKRRCEKCLEYARKGSQRRRAESKKQGLCARSGCNHPPAAGKAKCAQHIKEYNDQQRKYRHQARERRVCMVCAKPLPPNHKPYQCSSCSAYARELIEQKSAFEKQLIKLRKEIFYAKKMSFISLPANYKLFIEWAVEQLRERAKFRGIFMDIDAAWAIAEYEQQDGKCGYQKCRSVLSTKVYKLCQRSDRQFSWDRINGKDKATEIKDYEVQQSTPFDRYWNADDVKKLEQKVSELEAMDVDAKENISPDQPSTKQKKKKRKKKNPYSRKNTIICCFRCNCGRRHY